MNSISPECQFASLPVYDGQACSGKAVYFWVCNTSSNERECFCEAHKGLAWGMHNNGWHKISREEYLVHEVMKS
jgi:hypothetical protein